MNIKYLHDHGRSLLLMLAAERREETYHLCHQLKMIAGQREYLLDGTNRTGVSIHCGKMK